MEVEGVHVSLGLLTASCSRLEFRIHPGLFLFQMHHFLDCSKGEVNCLAIFLAFVEFSHRVLTGARALIS